MTREGREVKVPLPTSLHLKLHVLKLREGRPIAEVVEQALREHFARRDR